MCGASLPSVVNRPRLPGDPNIGKHYAPGTSTPSRCLEVLEKENVPRIELATGIYRLPLHVNHGASPPHPVILVHGS